MTSVTKFLKQVPSGSQYFSAASLSAGNLYELVPASSNVVGNYPPGTIQLIPASPALPAMANAIARDMGKTIYGGVTTGGVAPSAFGFFRQIQILIPGGITSAQGFIGGIAGNTFGIIGGTDTYTKYATYYIPVVVGGITAVVPSVSAPVVASGSL
jgi:hypothetical protein